MSARNKDLYCIYALLNERASGESNIIERVSISHIISVAYFTAGIALIIVAVQSKYVPVHVCLVGVLNVIASCGAYGKRRGTLYALTLISFISLTFGLVMLAAMTFTFSQDILNILALMGTIFYVVLSITSLAYAMTQINKFT